MIMREGAPEPADRERGGKHKRYRVQIGELGTTILIGRTTIEEEQRAEQAAEKAAKRTDVLPKPENHPRVTAQLVREVEQHGEDMGPDDATDEHPSPEPLAESRIKAEAGEPLLNEREAKPRSERDDDAKSVNGQWAQMPGWLAKVGKHRDTPYAACKLTEDYPPSNPSRSGHVGGTRNRWRSNSRVATVAVLKTQVGIIGAGPSGLILARMLAQQGIESVILESQSRAHCEQRARAGVLEHDAANLLEEIGVGDRMRREGLVHHGIFLRFGGRDHRIDMAELTGGRTITVYGQHEIIKDLIAAAIADGQALHFDVGDVSVSDLDSKAPTIRYRQDRELRVLECDVIAGCDGFHGVCRPSIPADAIRSFTRTYPFAWLGILSASAPASHELVYARHERGFALQSMRSPEITACTSRSLRMTRSTTGATTGSGPS